jgi:predicted small metal-binding protein
MTRLMQGHGLDIDCGFKATGETISEVLESYIRHAKIAHPKEEMTPEPAAKVEPAFQEV